MQNEFVADCFQKSATTSFVDINHIVLDSLSLWIADERVGCKRASKAQFYRS